MALQRMASQSLRADKAGRRLKKALSKTARNRSRDAIQVALRAYSEDEYAQECTSIGQVSMAPALRRIRRAKLNKKHMFNVCEIASTGGTPTTLAVSPRSKDANGQRLADSVLKSTTPSSNWRAGDKVVALFDAMNDKTLQAGQHSGTTLVVSDFVVSNNQTFFVASACNMPTDAAFAVTPRSLGIDKGLFEKLQNAFVSLLGVYTE